MKEEIEVLDENIFDNDGVVSNNDETIFDNIFEDNPEEEVVDAYEEDMKKEEIKQKRITKIQIGLIVFLFVFATIVYFFGYDFVEPFIKID